MSRWEDIRSRYPAVERRVYLNTAAGGPIPSAAATAGEAYYRSSCADGDIHWDDWLARVEDVRRRTAGLMGAGPDDLAFVTNASAGLNHAARMLAGRGGVLLVEGDFPSITWPWMQHGFETRFVKPARHGGVTIDELEAAADAETGVLALGLVQYRTGYRYRLDELAEWCGQRGIALVVDATQGLGALQVDVSDLPVDFLVTSAYKWLTAGYGVGAIYVNPRHRSPEAYPAVGWRSARDPYALDAGTLDVTAAAAALEGGHPPFAGIFSLGASLAIQEEIGAPAIEERVLQLADRVRAGLDRMGIEHLSATESHHRSGIVAAAVPEAGRAAAELEARGVLVSERGGTMRISTHMYNLESDVDTLLDALAERR